MVWKAAEWNLTRRRASLSDCWNSQLTPMAIRINVRRSANQHVVRGETQGGHAGRAWRIRLADTRGYSRKTKRCEFRPVALTETNRSEVTFVGNLLRYVHTLQIKLRGCPRRQALRRCASIQIRQDDWGPSRGSAECNFFVRHGIVIPFTTYTHTFKHMYHPGCQSRLWVLCKSDTIEARVHRRYKTSSRWKNGVEIVQLKYFEETINLHAH